MSLKKTILLMVPLFTITSIPFSDPVFLTDWNWTNINGYIVEKSQAVPEPTMLSLLPISLLALSGLVRKKQ